MRGPDMGALLARTAITCALVASSADEPQAVVVQVPLDAGSKLNVADVVPKLAAASGIACVRPKGDLRLPVTGLGGSLTRTMLAESLGPRVTFTVEDRSFSF